jgi:outer membrane receptor protein involved in Fe transport
MKNRLIPGTAASVFAILASGMAMPAFAQTTPPADDSPADAEIVVTAQKREQTQLDVPLSITAISGETVSRRGASTIEDLQYAVPGLSITQFSPGQQRVQLRGISVFSGLPTVGVYMDEMPLNVESNQTGQDVRLLDIARVEVLRGPQGTLYGQGAVGGTIRYITNEVDLDRVSVSGDGEVAGVAGGGTDWSAGGVANLPLVTDRLGLRVAGAYQHLGGWIDNPLIADRNANAGHTLTLRGRLSAVISEAFRLTVTAQHQDLKIGAQNLSDDDQQVFDALPTPYRSRATLANALATYDFGPATLLSSTSYLDRRDVGTGDLTGYRAFVPLPPGTPPTAIQSIGTVASKSFEIFSQELRLSSNGDGPFTWTVGGFYRNSRTFLSVDTVITPNLAPPGFRLYDGRGTAPDNSRSWAAFGEASYRITDTLTVLAGLRYFHDRRTQDTASTIFGATAIDQGRDTFTAASPRFNLSWQPNRLVHIYANVAKGFRSGGFNLTSAGAGLGTVPPSFGPDTLWTYEVGGKFQTADRRLVVEVAGYRNEWSDVQTTSNLAGLPITFTTNGGKISGWGLDGSVSYSPIRALTFTLTAGWNNMAYDSDTVEHLAGDRADYVPRFTGSASAEYRFNLGNLPGYARVDYQHADRFQLFVRNFQVGPAFSDEQNILNARLGLSGNAWNASLFVRNILNRDSVIYPAVGSLLYPARLQPRTAGIRLGFRY